VEPDSQFLDWVYRIDPTGVVPVMALLVVGFVLVLGTMLVLTEMFNALLIWWWRVR
jgi:hypothetical protein